MEFILKVITIETKPRVGYFIVHNDNYEMITNIDTKNRTAELSNGESISLMEAGSKVAKLVGEVSHTKDNKVTTQTYSIVHGDYNRIFDSLNREVEYNEDTPAEDRKYKYWKDAILNNVPVTYQGFFDIILSRTVVDEVVNIINIKTIDKYELYKKEDRIGTVVEYNKSNHTFVIKLSSSNKILTCKREDFTKLHDDNTIQMIHVKCPYCNR